jgi:hypothetical protein
VDHLVGNIGEGGQEVGEELLPVVVVLRDPQEEPVPVQRIGGATAGCETKRGPPSS